ncbi:alpha/beta fold hydrolase [Photobacterium sp. CCB-ST2H9]|uniref:esterase/lipase family protein n=1 Tax=Photobacterium sp. CCB-ST2H9 TaxID=2912855 RepID=UPI002003494F|nr:alpha/beta fold hydrolase [Photobacterium sp. CCB-ST2H9]UTM59113.1 alpha/beta fold hydrolase [Photobacterium sp. CCB-ST2H9]
MKQRVFRCLFFSCPYLAASSALVQAATLNPGCVVLLHGLARTAHSMSAMSEALKQAGYQTVNVDYPSTQMNIPALAERVIPEGVSQCGHTQPVHFVTHSMGGILVRQYLSVHHLPALGRVVMLAPPNQGSEVVDTLRDFFLFQWIYGPAGQQLGTDVQSPPKCLGPVNFELGVIAGNRSIDFLTSWPLPDPHDGKVSVESTKVAGMKAHLVLPATHTLIMNDDETIQQAVYFLGHGFFLNPDISNQEERY